MAALRAVLAEIVHMFVDDGSLALALVTWCTVIGLAGLALPTQLPASGPALFLGCTAILLVNVVRAARAHAGSGERGP